MTPTPHAPTVAPSIDAPGSATSIGEAATRSRAHTVLIEKNLTVEDLLGLLPLGSVAWHRKVAAALAGEARFTSLTLALFAEAVGADVFFLITGEQRPEATVRTCLVDEVSITLLGDAR